MNDLPWTRIDRPEGATTTQCDYVRLDGYCCVGDRAHDGPHRAISASEIDRDGRLVDIADSVLGPDWGDRYHLGEVGPAVVVEVERLRAEVKAAKGEVNRLSAWLGMIEHSASEDANMLRQWAFKAGMGSEVDDG